MKTGVSAKKALPLIIVLFTILAVCFFAARMVLPTAATDSNGAVAGNTSALYTQDLLSKAGITLEDGDKVHREDVDGVVVLSVVRAFDVKITYRGEELVVKVADGTVEEAISAAGITLTGAEAVTPALESAVTADTEIIIVADNIVYLTADGETNAYSTKADTVQEFFEQEGVIVGEDDILNVNLSEGVYDSMEIVLQRVEYKEEIKTEVIDYEFITKEDSDMLEGIREIEQYGIEGEKKVTYKCKYIDGELADSQVIEEEVISEPVHQVELVGTKEEETEPPYVYEEEYYEPPQVSSKPQTNSGGAGTFTDASGNTVSYKKVLTGSATAYYAAEGSHTATGVPVYVGGVAVNPNIIPYGTKMYIVSSDGSRVYGYATAVDTGGALMSGSCLVDLFYPTYQDCVNWGRRDVTVYIL